MPVKSPQHRPPQDMNCPMLPIVDGCAHGKCRFCDIFTDIPFTALPMETVISDIEGIAKYSTAITRRIYLTGGNPFTLPTKRLIEVFDEVEKRIPTVNSYGGFCRIADIANKSDEDLALLASRGVDDIAIGAESGFDEALAFMRKGHTAADIIEQAKRLHKAGISFTFFYLTGMAGAGHTEENAIASAKVFSEAAPKRILIVTMTPTKTWPLAADIQAGRWKVPTEIEMAHEIRTLIANLDCDCTVNCSHDTDILRFQGRVPENQEKMLELLDNLIPKMNEQASRRMREMLHKATF
ncbi:radical SAM protein [Adlercreutzia sp. ZJ154]|uniref:radical SAM protein n=1 Tax=Adlercreutzia sp. ZJ154 TaxID=2709790 RepID=UPI0013EA5B76|nr:radical SAM protein [Adlercreutzia sp. ZJ154]